MMTAQQLKNSILQRAIEGKLVEQRPEEGTAKELLNEIKLEKEKLVKEGKIKKSKSLPAITEDEIPFEIPDSWEWVRLGDIGITITGKTPATSNAEYYNGTIPFIGPGNISANGIISYNSEKKLTDEGLTHSRKLEKGDIAQVCIGGSIGKAALITEICGFNQQINAIKPTLVSSLYLYMVLISDYFYKALKTNSTGTATPIINKDGWNNLLISIPPLSEQHRIVAKIEELLPLVDQYDKAYSQLTALNEKFPQDMKKSILQYAIEGKLVEQRSEEGTAKELLKEIKLEKEKLIKEGKIKKSKPLPPITEDEIPFDIPENWEWGRFGEITINRDNERIPLSVSQRENLDKIYDYYGASGVIDKVDRYLFSKDLLLIGEDGANLLMRSKPIAFIAKGKYWVNNHAHVIDVFSSIYMVYLMYYINTINLSPYVTGTAQPKMNQAKMNSIPVPIPPLSEQKRIVAKIEELMPLCDKLSKTK
ncbi:restriction endonuclease subunit S [uncultured Anaerovibrio sp.]|uniref:restriction endonuclease subunit S n=1 Tax=uncultured Anaerovibrio sp. TaxID=361586 RepID=UPI0026179141|nr:restriction endonuclease subunit S [uncultured Anaerovibrio sp.]